MEVYKQIRLTGKNMMTKQGNGMEYLWYQLVVRYLQTEMLFWNLRDHKPNLSFRFEMKNDPKTYVVCLSSSLLIKRIIAVYCSQDTEYIVENRDFALCKRTRCNVGHQIP